MPVFETFTGANGTGLTATGSEPAGTAQGDVLVAVLAQNTRLAPVTVPAGWTLRLTQNYDDAEQVRIYTIVRGASAPSFTWTLGGPVAWSLVIFRLSDALGVPDAQASDVDTSSPYTCLSVTTTVDDCLVVCICGNEAGQSQTFAWASPSTERWDQGVNVGTSGATFVQASAGATPTVDAVSSGGTGRSRPVVTLAFATASVAVTGTAAQTLPAATQAADGAAAVGAQAGQTLPGLTQAVGGSVAAEGAAAQTLPAPTQAAAGTAAATAEAAQTLPAVAQDAAGDVAATGTAAQSLPSVTQDAAGNTSVTAAAAQTLPMVGQEVAATATVTTAGAQMLPAASQVVVGNVDALPAGSVTQTLPAVVQQVSGTVETPAAGTLAQTLPMVTQAVTAEALAEAVVAQVLPALLQQILAGQPAPNITNPQVAVPDTRTRVAGSSRTTVTVPDTRTRAERT